MKAKLPIVVIFSFLSLCMVGLSSCQRDSDCEGEKITITLSETELNLEEGATRQLSVTGVPEGQVVIFSSANPAIASINAETGELLAVAPGETIITAREAKSTAECKVSVRKLNEMPLLIFNPQVEREELTDERIFEHERLCGRVYTDAVPVNSQIYTFPGFYNKQNSVVTCVLYNLHYDEVQEDLIMAYCTEPITRLDKVKELLAPLGFTRFEPRKFQGSEEVYIFSPSDDYAGLHVHIRQTDQINLNAQSFIHFIWERKNGFPIKYHPTISNVKDFPSLSKSGEGREQVMAYEQELGLREYDGYEDGLRFILRDDKIGTSNISFSEYQDDDESMGISILSRMVCVRDLEDLHAQELKDYIAYNGYGEDIQAVFSDTGILSFNKEGDACIVFIEATMGDCWMSLVKHGHHNHTRTMRQFIQSHSQATPEELDQLFQILK